VESELEVYTPFWTVNFTAEAVLEVIEVAA
jgi:hypothetical protein